MARVFYSYGHNMLSEGNNSSISTINNRTVYRITAAWFIFVFVCFSFFRNNYVSVTKNDYVEIQKRFIERSSDEYSLINDSILLKSGALGGKQNLSFSHENYPKMRFIDAIVFIGNTINTYFISP
jgi:hypothetical protein